ncbi:hypothetical protein OIU78_004382 [Salix suchowensis]|nr:hypothetical protein OIU78_004382 [Salix suchowensis]
MHASPHVFSATHISSSVIISWSVICSLWLWFHSFLPFRWPLNYLSIHK